MCPSLMVREAEVTVGTRILEGMSGLVAEEQPHPHLLVNSTLIPL